MRFTLFLMSIVTTSASACPDLQGAYRTCRSIDNSIMEMEVSQKIVNKYFQYTFLVKDSASNDVKRETYIADGKPRMNTEIDPDTDTSIKTSVSTSCTSEALTTKVSAQIDDVQIVSLKIRTTKKGNQLTQTINGTSMESPVDDTVVCE